MEPLITLYEKDPVARETLPLVLASYYDGGMAIKQGSEGGLPYVVANFVETLDGVISYELPGQHSGDVISGKNEADQMVMGLLRAQADAIIFGNSSWGHDARHVHIPSLIFPDLAAEYHALRVRQQKRDHLPMSVIMTASGHIDFQDATFHTPGLRTLIVTTTQGYEQLTRQKVPTGTDIRVVEPEQGWSGQGIPPKETLALLGREYGVRVAVFEGGAKLLASLVDEQVVDELFLTLAPQIAGRTPDVHRAALVEGHAFTPEEAPWLTLLSIKLAGSHLLLRYSFRR
ncbi:MAG TPA: dihydrofolate reductase family protein [Ktedonobacteraceae bacterium]|nr:dihydrofolate reductase family protein [Ktedonobacteraceae bacterium]